MIEPVKKLLVACPPTLGLALVSAAALAADIHSEPRADLRVEQNDNFTLSPGENPNSDIYGYVADLSDLFYFRTPRGGTDLRPRVRIQEFPDRDDLEKFEWFLDMNSAYRTERSRFLFEGHASKQDVYNSETASGDFDPSDPGGGADGDSGEILIGETRTGLFLRPDYEFRVSERTSIGASVLYQLARYDVDEGEATKTDYDYSVLRGYMSWALSPSTDLSVGAYGSKYEAQDDSEETDAVGGSVGVSHRWNATDGLEATLFYEENDTTEFIPVVVNETTTGFGGELTAYRKLEISEWRLSVGRSFIPTGDSGKATLDQVRLQYDRQLSPRLEFHAAGRYDSRNALGTVTLDTGRDRDYARGDLSLRWYVTPTWYVGGGYAYIWEEREAAISDADNNKFYINFGYRALSRGTPLPIQDSD